MSSAKPWTRVIVLTPPLSSDGAGLNDELRSQFAQRDWFAIEQHDPCEAMAELCLRERTQSSRAAWGLQRIEQIAMVVHHPSCWDHDVINDLITAVQRYVPTATIWLADDGELHALTDREPAIEQPSATPALAPLHANGLDHASVAAPKAAQMQEAVAADSRITRQEIQMLLDDEQAHSTIRGALP